LIEEKSTSIKAKGRKFQSTNRIKPGKVSTPTIKSQTESVSLSGFWLARTSQQHVSINKYDIENVIIIRKLYYKQHHINL
jgi:hypothetical protein